MKSVRPIRRVKAGQINALGLIDELQHYALKQYREQKNPRVMQEALDYLTAQIGPEEVEKTLRRFVDEFPPVAVYKGEITIDEYLKGATNGTPHHQIELEEMLMLWLANQNPAFEPYRELFDDTPLRQETAYPQVMTGMREFFATQPDVRPGQPEPDRFSAHAGAERARFAAGSVGIHARALGHHAGPVSLSRAGRPRFHPRRREGHLHRPRPDAGSGLRRGGAARLAGLVRPGGQRVRLRCRSPSASAPICDWMPRLVLIAKNTYVWLDQLSKKYQRPITRLDQIPDEELDHTAALGLHRPVADRPVGAQPRPRSASSR